MPVRRAGLVCSTVPQFDLREGHTDQRTWPAAALRGKSKGPSSGQYLKSAVCGYMVLILLAEQKD